MWCLQQTRRCCVPLRISIRKSEGRPTLSGSKDDYKRRCRNTRRTVQGEGVPGGPGGNVDVSKSRRKTHGPLYKHAASRVDPKR